MELIGEACIAGMHFKKAMCRLAAETWTWNSYQYHNSIITPIAKTLDLKE